MIAIIAVVILGAAMLSLIVMVIGLLTNVRTPADVYWKTIGGWKKKFGIPYIPEANLASFEKGDEILDWLSIQTDTKLKGSVYFNDWRFSFFPRGGGMFEHYMDYDANPQEMQREFAKLLVAFKKFIN